MKIAVKVLGLLLTVLFLLSGGTKLAGMEPHIEHFAGWGYPDWFRLFVGAWEVLFGALFQVPRFAAIAAGALSLGMVGAIVTVVTRGNPPEALFPAVLLIVIGIVWRTRSTG